MFNKLVRDKIPEKIIAEGRISKTRYLDDNEYKIELDKKLQEEVKEYIQDDNIEELADIIEVIYAILDAKKISIEELEKVRLKKVEKNGAFKQKIFLESSE